MEGSFQGFPPPGLGGPPSMVYPTTATTTTGTTSREQEGSSLHSNGSFGMVFIVLAIILFISVIACVIGRLCSNKTNKKAHDHHMAKAHRPNHSHNHNHNHNQSQNHMHGGPHLKDRDMEFGIRSKEGDIMVGFEPKTRAPTSKVANFGDPRGAHNGFGSGRGMDHGGLPRDF